MKSIVSLGLFHLFSLVLAMTVATASSSAQEAIPDKSSRSKLKSSQEKAASEKVRPAHHVERVGGNFNVFSIEKVAGGFQIRFKAVVPSGRFDEILLESSHIHIGVKVGQQLRLSAEVIGGDLQVAEATQVLVFLPSQRGEVPVWMLSSTQKSTDLNAAKYLEMHAPETDFTIL